MEDNGEPEEMLKRVEYYSALLSAFIDGKTEIDKQLLTIAVAALGFIFMFTEKIELTCLTTSLLIFATLSFLSTIIIILRIFSLNSEFIENELTGKSDGVKSVTKKMIITDFLAKFFFALGLAVITTLFIINLTKGNHMAKKESDLKPLNKSLSNLDTLKPQGPRPKQESESSNPPKTSTDKENKK